MPDEAIDQQETAAGDPQQQQDTADKGTPSAAEYAALRAQLDTLQSQIQEQQRTAQHWHEEYTKATKPAADKSTSEEETDMLELLTSKGEKGLREWAKKNGFVQQTEVDSKIAQRAEQMVREQELIKRYPELAPEKRKSKDNEFFQLTAQTYGELVKSGVPEHMAMQLAAEKTELELMRTGKYKTPREREDEAKQQRETERRARIAAQSGARGSRDTQQEADDELSPEQRMIARRMLTGLPGADGKPMTEAQAEEAYKARATKGVAMKGTR